MPKNHLEDLKNHLFQVMEEINNPEKESDVAKALEKGKIIASLAAQANNTFKIQLDAVKLADAIGSKANDGRDPLKELLSK